MPHQESAEQSRWIALYVLCTGVLMIVLDVTVVNVALPTIQDDLDFTQSSLAWVVNAYLIAFGGLLLLAGRFGDLIGRRTVFLAGLFVFTTASLLCGVAGSQEMLVIARFVQGIGGAMTSAVVLGMIVTMFPERGEQARAIGVYAFVASAGGSIGLLAGGVLTQAINWHWIFFINVPIGIATAVLARRLLPRDEGIGLDKGSDIPGAVLITSALMLGVYTIVKPAADKGWGSAEALGSRRRVAGAAGGVHPREATAHTPLVPLRIFRSRNVYGRQHDPGADGRRHVRDVLSRCALPAAGARLRRAGDGPGVPAHHDRHGRDYGALLGAADHALRRPNDAVPGPGADRTGLALFTLAGPDGGYFVHVLPSIVLIGPESPSASRR